MAFDRSESDICGLLEAMVRGEPAAAEKLFPLVYEELHRIAAGYMGHERRGHTLQATALVHEAFLRLAGGSTEVARYESKRHFVATAATAMRRVLINHANARGAEKRGGGQSRVTLDGIAAEFSDRSIDLLSLEESLLALAELDPRQARLVELRFYGGMSVEDCAATLGISVRTAHSEWAHARAWLRDRVIGG